MKGENGRQGPYTLAEIALTLSFIVLVRLAFGRWLPLCLPKSRKAALLAGTVGGGAGYILGRLWPLATFGHGFSVPWVLAGVALGILIAGLGPFLRILLRL